MSDSQAIPESSRIWLCERLNTDWQDLALQERSLPPPGPGHLRLRMRALAVNFPDLLMLRGDYQFKPELPFSPGMEGCAEVLALGEGVTGFEPGQRVSVGARCGLMAEQVNLPAQSVWPAPEDFTDAEVAGFRVAFLTAWIALVHRGRIRPKETLLVHGATGGMGMAAVMLGHHLGARVLATGTSREKLALTEDWGAADTLMLEKDAGNLRSGVLELTGGTGADLIFDPVGGDVFRQSMRCIAWDGRLLVIGFAAGEIASVPANIPLIKGFSIAGVRAGESCRRDPQLAQRAQQALDGLAKAGLKPHIFEEIPFEQAPRALKMLAQRLVAGKIAILL